MAHRMRVFFSSTTSVGLDGVGTERCYAFAATFTTDANDAAGKVEIAVVQPDHFVEHGDPGRLLAICGLDAEGITRSIQQRFGSRLTVVRPAAAG